MSYRHKTVRVADGVAAGLPQLRVHLAAANDLGFHLSLTSTADEFEALAEALKEAYDLAAQLARRTTRTGCAEHPQGPVDPTPEDGWGRCLLCNSRRRTGRARRALTPCPDAQLTGATSDLNRAQRAVQAGRERSAPETRGWREPEIRHTAALDSPILVQRAATADQDRRHAAALARARREKAERRQQT
ncbi:hypothetical protein [Kitasatospora sp. NPDC058046]|uniref:hypothetical protein n=1 Tax=Kitasatospora sp. NPDC058046 TaxID=3346312 RepID=UPI0036D7A85F